MCEFPLPSEPLTPVNVTATPVVINSGLVYNSKLSSSITFAKTVLGRMSVTIPEIFSVAPIETAVPATPMNVEPGVYVSSSLVLKKWLGKVITFVIVLIVPVLDGLNVLEYIGTPLFVNKKSFLSALKPLAPS